MKHEYSNKTVTSWGGMLKMKRLLEKIGISKKMEEIGVPESKSNNRISAISIIEAFWVSVWIGASRFSHTTLVRLDETLCKIFEWKRVASGTTFTRFFRKFSLQENTRLFTSINQWFFGQMDFKACTLDVDSSVLTRYGEQEGSRKGYNPHKKGRPSHHPLFAFIAELRMVANCWLRSGDTSSSTNIIHFLEETFEILKDKKISLFRADSGFCSEKVFSFLEDRGIEYAIAARIHALIQHKIREQKAWKLIDEGIWISEIIFQGNKWSKARRAIVIKQSVAIRPNASGKILKLFNDEEFYEHYRYQCIFTNQTLEATKIWEQYKGRADAENRIQELKNDFGADGFCVNSFYGTEAALRMVMIAYNLMSLYRISSKQNAVYQKLSTLRMNCFAVGSWLVRKGNNLILKMSVPIKRRAWYEGLFQNIKQTVWPLSFKT